MSVPGRDVVCCLFSGLFEPSLVSHDIRKTFKRYGSCACFLHIKGHINIGVTGVMGRQRELGAERTCMLSAVLKDASSLLKPKDYARAI